MPVFDLFAAAILGGLGLALIVALLRLMFASFFGNSGSWLEKYRIKQKENLLERAEVYIKAADFASVSSLLRGAFYLDQIKSDARLVERVHNHHLGILSKIITLADRFNMHLDSLPIVEDLLISRAQLMKTIIEKKAARSTLRKKGSEKNRKTPDWALNEFGSQLLDLRDKLGTNRRSLESQIDKLFTGLASARSPDEVTYH